MTIPLRITAPSCKQFGYWLDEDQSITLADAQAMLVATLQAASQQQGIAAQYKKIKHSWQSTFESELVQLQEQAIESTISEEQFKKRLINLQRLIGSYTVSPFAYQTGLQALLPSLPAPYRLTIQQVLSVFKIVLSRKTRFIMECLLSDVHNAFTTCTYNKRHIQQLLHQVIVYRPYLPFAIYAAVMQSLCQQLMAHF